MPRLILAVLLIASLSLLTACDGPGAVAPGETATHTGELASGDSTLVSGEFYDEYPLSGKSGGTYKITLTSEAFDPYIIVMSADGDWQREIDDSTEGDFNESVLEVTLPDSGRYAIAVTTFEPGESGAYTLTVENTGSK